MSRCRIAIVEACRARSVAVRVCALALAVVLVPVSVSLGACSGSGGPSSTPSVGTTPLQPYTAVYASFDAAAATPSADGSSSIDVSHVADGYVAAQGTSSARLKFQVICGQSTYNYDLDSSGTPAIFPLNCGSGTYTFRVMQNTSGDKYVELQSLTQDVALADEFQPFLRNNAVCNYGPSSRCVALADQLRGESTTEIDLVTRIYDYITDNVAYDYDEAGTVEAGYLPDPDEVLSSRKGICFDYASLAAAMMRSQGIPCKIITGYVDPENIYHAWNVIWFQDSGWVSVEIAVSQNEWKRIDMTFAAAEGDEGALGTERTYTDRFVY